jgi:uncharacterized LabA/DUF88 family protein
MSTSVHIDLGYVNKIRESEFNGIFRRRRLDILTLSRAMCGRGNLLGTFIYWALPWQSAEPTPEERNRLNRAHYFADGIRRLPRCHLRLGRQRPRGVNSQGIKIFRQKGVDGWLVADVTVLSLTRQITEACLFVGDGDFVPAVEMAKAHGIIVHVFHGRNIASDLSKLCDESIRVDRALLEHVHFHSNHFPR